MTYKILHGNNLDILPTLPDNSVDSIVTDPPYELGFMGKKWDSSGIAYSVELWQQCLRVLKPGGHLLSFGGTRTWHRVAVGIEDAGFEIRDSMAWLYGSGFPKSLDVSKAIDKAAGAEREVLTEVVSDLFGDQEVKQERKTGIGTGKGSTAIMGDGNRDLTAPATPEAKQWQGWGTALKPAFEPIVVARKPIEGTVANNVLKWGTGGLNIDGSRIGTEERTHGWAGRSNSLTQERTDAAAGMFAGNGEGKTTVQGRWPANIILDPYTAELLDEQSGITKSTIHSRGGGSNSGYQGGWGDDLPKVRGLEDKGGASRFFKIAVSEKPDTMNLCKNTTANNVANYLITIRATIGNTALTSAGTEQEKRLAQAVKDAGIQCDSCGISIAQSLVELKTLALSGLTPLQDFMHTYKSSTLIQNLALIVEQWVNTDTIPTTTSLSKLFGSVPPAIAEHIRPESLKLDSDQVRFLYQAKASKRDRNEGLDELPEIHAQTTAMAGKGMPLRQDGSERKEPIKQNFHPTVKPTTLMEYLIKLVTPPGGVVLDPFTGSGSTGKAAILQGFDFIGIEMTEEYLPIIEGRLKHAEQLVAEAKEQDKLKENEVLF